MDRLGLITTRRRAARELKLEPKSHEPKVSYRLTDRSTFKHNHSKRKKTDWSLLIWANPYENWISLWLLL